MKERSESVSSVKTEANPTVDYSDSSDEEDFRNTIGNVPLHWYDAYDHIGYSLDGLRIPKKSKKEDDIDEFLAQMEDPNYWRTVTDPQTGEKVVLGDDAIDVIQNIQKARYPNSDYDPYPRYVDFFTGETATMPVCDTSLTKRSFIPSKLEEQKVRLLVKAIKARKRLKEKMGKKLSKRTFYDLWEDETPKPLSRSQQWRLKMHLPAPKMKLPDHAESYNPPAEYLFTDKELKEWEEQDEYERRLDFIPKKYSSLRLVPAYDKYLKDRYRRCLDLYRAPRKKKMRLNVNPNDLLPQLPKPSDLRPFPTQLSIVYTGHQGPVRAVDVEAGGRYLASGGDDCTVRIWEVSTGRCLQVKKCAEPVQGIVWYPGGKLTLLAVASGTRLLFINAGVGNKQKVADTDTFVDHLWKNFSKDTDWQLPSDEQDCFLLAVNHGKTISQVIWHVSGDYLATLAPGSGSSTILVHHLGTLKTQIPFSKTKGQPRRILFHPTRPQLYVASSRYLRVFNLVKQILTKKITTSVSCISGMAIHPKGDDTVIGGMDGRLNWYDMDNTVKPCKVFRYHDSCVRAVACHGRYPLFASVSDDATAKLFHCTVYNDYDKMPLIVPLKILRSHKKVEAVGSILDCTFHTTQPWLFTSGADGLSIKNSKKKDILRTAIVIPQNVPIRSFFEQLFKIFSCLLVSMTTDVGSNKAVKSPLSLLHEICGKKGLTPVYELLTSQGQGNESMFVYRLCIDSLVATGKGKSKKLAKQNVALNWLMMIVEQGNHRDWSISGQTPAEAKQFLERLVAHKDDEQGGMNGDGITKPNTVYVNVLQQYCVQRHYLRPVFTEEGMCGAQHDQTFFVSVELGEYKKTGCGRSKKLAKQNAAHLMLEFLYNTPEEELNASLLIEKTDDSVMSMEFRKSFELRSLKINQCDMAYDANFSLETFKNMDLINQIPTDLHLGLFSAICSELDLDYAMSEMLDNDKNVVLFMQIRSHPSMVLVGSGKTLEEAKLSVIFKFLIALQQELA
ncbi:Ribosome biogenesis protein bop1-B [Trichinella pseudospiralis]|uniref:Ribosome biogenesis protein BOP1 homolog n=1 Tax=Trichinella pseudospiralis TaxID=6337 RepID=A0A0V1F8T1_TRIPS|nr:Ribosome biogenesis protein bop1-B [Trichinella pseudospiralis]